MTTVFLMMMMVISASARPLPAHNLSRPEFHQNVTADFTGYFRSNNTGNDSSVSSSMNALPQQKDDFRSNNTGNHSPVSPATAHRQVYCVLPTCLTANLGSSLQTGDKKAGSLTSDPFGNGKK
ncbi:uncharacterized protein zgc:193726 isoform X1 [Thunnus maccoyii]|uniref:uncharacterized protein zgc:193726 isoform X1 n=1 Tax=Thunnus maccoyii TaxID=8240 RepID=UPI001C4B287B|nr:uncharacterized protein zgc:193726 isoform X1 [Thunnus maccoyii]XP_042259551.1 uncharacterized protein zgc:193726 isoform X1 [Thunnus maccoyii]